MEAIGRRFKRAGPHNEPVYKWKKGNFKINNGQQNLKKITRNRLKVWNDQSVTYEKN